MMKNNLNAMKLKTKVLKFQNQLFLYQLQKKILIKIKEKH